ncbi:MAG TPA: type I 3-dehydroquinate dehydratase [Candidatus Saccharimonadales bacterium]|nr:type I 3-dehydroquinate dehydratase [Candidatus Saccharimonadales bacterium]
MKNKYCLPIIDTSLDKVRQIIKSHQQNYGYFEVWLDYMQNVTASDAISLAQNFPGKIIFVFRRRNLEPINIPLEKRVEILRRLSDEDCLVDFDITPQAEDLDYVQKNNLQFKKIVSYHDYKQTPTDLQIRQIITRIESFGPDIIKLSVFCNSNKDALRLLQLEQDLSAQDKPHIVLGMGENGLITRIFGTLWSNALAFVPETADAESAPGQITRDKFEKIINDLKDL